MTGFCLNYNFRPQRSQQAEEPRSSSGLQSLNMTGTQTGNGHRLRGQFGDVGLSTEMIYSGSNRGYCMKQDTNPCHMFDVGLLPPRRLCDGHRGAMGGVSKL